MSSRRYPRGLTLIELLVVLAIVTTLVSVLLPGLANARAAAKKAACAAVQRQLGVTINAYALEYRQRVPLGWGADPDVGFYYARVIESRAGNHLYHNDAPIGPALLYESGYLPDPRLLYCAASDDNEAGYRGSRGWNPAGGLTRANAGAISSYYYRYVEGIVPAIGKDGYIYFNGNPLDPSNNIDNYNAQIDRMSFASALWCSSKIGTYHPDGYNVLSYGGAVRFANRNLWPLGFPRNVWWDYTDCWGNMSDGLGYSAYPDFEFWDVADRLWR